MSNQAQNDYDRQFQEDMAKATALSLEQQALDDYRRHKKYGDYQGGNVDYYAQQDNQQQINSSLPQRRHSEVHQSPVALGNLHSSRTLPTQTGNGNGNRENDLICFSSPTSIQPESESINTFDRLIDDLQRMQTNTPQRALQPLGPVVAKAYGSVPSATGMQLVPYQPTALQPQQRQLNNDELQRLYSMPNQLALQSVVPATFVYYPTFPTAIVPGSAAYMAPQYPSQGFGYGFAPNNIGNTHVDFTRPHITPTSVSLSNSSNHSPSSNSISHSVSSTPAANNLLRITPPAGIPSVGPPLQARRSDNNLIDLNKDDFSRVSVLEAFDPLLNESSVSQK